MFMVTLLLLRLEIREELDKDFKLLEGDLDLEVDSTKKINELRKAILRKSSKE